MKNLRLLAVLAVVAAFAWVMMPATVQAQTVNHGPRFVDENGDGYNDNAPDADGDGIPNGQDPDYVPVGNGGQGPRHGGDFVDEDGDGFNDNAPDADGDGIPNGQDPDYVPSGNGRNGGQGFHNSDSGSSRSERGNRVNRPERGQRRGSNSATQECKGVKANAPATQE